MRKKRVLTGSVMKKERSRIEVRLENGELISVNPGSLLSDLALADVVRITYLEGLNRPFSLEVVEDF